jgi:DNA-binding XRE family transcriptional regulator
LGVSRSSYTCYLTGHQRPSLAVAIRLSKYFKVQVQDIIFPIDELEGR